MSQYEEMKKLLPHGSEYVGNTGRIGCKTHDPDSSIYSIDGQYWCIKWLPQKGSWAKPYAVPACDKERILSLCSSR